MLTRPFALTLVAALTVGAASAQTPPAAVPAAVEPALAFGSSWGSSAGTHALALRSNGDVLTWGKNDNCRLGRNTNTSNGGIAAHIPTVVMHNAKAIAAAGTSSLVLTMDGKVYSWGATVQMTSGYYACDGPAPVPSLAGRVVARIGVGPEFGVAVTDSGDLYCFGDITACPVKGAQWAFARLSIPWLDGNVLDISVGGRHTLVLTKDRKLYAFGFSRFGQLGDPGFRQGGPGSDITRAPILTNVVSFAAGEDFSVAVKDDGTVWTWGSNGGFELCDGTTTVKVVPTQLRALAGQAAQVAAGAHAMLIRTKAGALFACGNNSLGALGLDPHQRGTSFAEPEPTQVPVPVIKSSALALAADYGAFSPDGCAVHISGLGIGGVRTDGIRGPTIPSSARFALRAGLSLCAPRSAAPMPDVDPGALHAPPPAPPAGVDCSAPTREIGRDWKDPRFAPIRQAMTTIERRLKENEAFTARLPERVRMITEAHVDGVPRLFVAAFPRARWSQTGCGVVGTESHWLGHVEVIFNGSLAGQYFQNEDMTPIRYLAGLPVYRLPRDIEAVVISKDGRIPVVPVTLADRLDKLAQILAKQVEDNAKQRTSQLEFTFDESAVRKAYEVLRKTDPTGAERYLEAMREANRQAGPNARKVAEQLASTGQELQRQVEALRVYRASFSDAELRSPWVQGDRSGPEGRQLNARIKVLESLPPESQAQVTDLGTRARALQRQAQTRGIAPEEAARLRSEANDLLNQAKAIVEAHRSRVAPEVTALQNDFELKLNRPGDASHARYFKDDPTFYDSADPGRIQLIALKFYAGASRDTEPAKARAWMDQVMNTLDYEPLKALIR